MTVRAAPATPRSHISESVSAALGLVAHAPHLAILVDVDAVTRSRHVRFTRAIALVLDALSLSAHVVLVSEGASIDAARLHRALPRSRWEISTTPAFVVADIRTKLSGACCVAISDREPFFKPLDRSDRGLALTAATSAIAKKHIFFVGDLGARAALWWLVNARRELLR